MICIYKITSPSGKIYIGQTWNSERRFKSYRWKDCKRQLKLHSSFEKYGYQSHILEILVVFHPTILQESIDFYEVYWWKYYKDMGYNMLNINKPGSHGKHSEETKLKIKIANTGKRRRKRTPEEIAIIVKSNKGKKRSEETKRKISEGQKGKIISKEAIEKCRQTKKKPFIMLDSDGNFIKEFDFTTDAANYLDSKHAGPIRLALSRKKNIKSYKGFQFIFKSEYNPNKDYRIHPRTDLWIEQYSLDGKFINNYPSLKQASESVGGGNKRTSISACCRKINKTAFGYIWKYKEL